MEATAIAAAVEAATAITTPTVKTASAATTVAAAVLGENVFRCAKQDERNEASQKRFQQHRFFHWNFPTQHVIVLEASLTPRTAFLLGI